MQSIIQLSKNKKIEYRGFSDEISENKWYDECVMIIAISMVFYNKKMWYNLLMLLCGLL